MRGLACLAGITAALIVVSSGGAASEASVDGRQGESAGKLRLGMTIPQVKTVLGAPSLVSKPEKRGTRVYRYLEFAWGDTLWRVGFVRPPGGKYRAVSIGMIQKG